MILVHEPDTLIRLIVRMMVHKVQVEHAGILLKDRDKDTYVFTVSRGETGQKVPAGFCRMDSHNPLIAFFRKRLDKQLFNDGSLIYDEGRRIQEAGQLTVEAAKALKDAMYQMEIFDSVACIPSYFRDELVGLLILGRKKNQEAFKRDELDFFTALASDVAMAIRNAQLFKDLELELDRRKRLFIHTTVALAAAIDAKDHYTHGHTSRVTNLSLEIARKLAAKNKLDLGAKFFEDLHIASLLHDIGKIGIPEHILNKKGKLTVGERNRIREHPEIGVTILQPIRELEEAIKGVKYHHESYDGTGYPEGLKGSQIPLIAAIIAAADAYDAMTTDRPYRRGLTKQEGIDEIKRVSGSQLNPEVAEALLEILHE
jgi:putative nucleotidyltransferase with HDIG domain